MQIFPLAPSPSTAPACQRSRIAAIFPTNRGRAAAPAPAPNMTSPLVLAARPAQPAPEVPAKVEAAPGDRSATTHQKQTEERHRRAALEARAEAPPTKKRAWIDGTLPPRSRFPRRRGSENSACQALTEDRCTTPAIAAPLACAVDRGGIQYVERTAEGHGDKSLLPFANSGLRELSQRN